jgi:hypothetical protein
VTGPDRPKTFFPAIARMEVETKREIWFSADADAPRGYRIVHWKGWLLIAVTIAAWIGLVAVVSINNWNGSWIVAGLAAVTAISWIMGDRHSDYF